MKNKKTLIITTLLIAITLILPSTTSIVIKKTTSIKNINTGNDKKTLTNREKYAVIVAGGPLFDQLQDEFWRSAQHAYYTLRDLGYKDDHIYYLSKGFFYPGVDRISFFISVRDAIAGWLASHSSYSSDVLIYLVDHGDSYGNFYPGRFLPISGQILNSWLRNVRYHICTIVIDACYSGNFMRYLSDDNTIVITCTDSESYGYAWNGDEVVFSKYFFNALSYGYSYGKAWEYADHAIADDENINTQNPQIDDNGDGIGHGTTGRDYLPMGGDGYLALFTYP